MLLRKGFGVGQNMDTGNTGPEVATFGRRSKWKKAGGLPPRAMVRPFSSSCLEIKSVKGVFSVFKIGETEGEEPENRLYFTREGTSN